jgi:LysR family transcriptional regulator, nitrogen assimilation regulatory protein
MRKLDREEPQLSDLRCFVLAAEHRSLTAAATAEGVAQSAFSRHLARVESALGGRLLHRTGRGVTPTELGQRVLPRAKALIAEARALADDAAGRWSLPSGTVDVGLLPSLSPQLTALLYARISKAYPGVHLRLHEAYSGEMQVMLAEGKIDVATLNRYRSTGLANKDAVLTAKTCLIVAADAPIARDKSVKFASLATLPLVLLPRPNTLRTVIEEIALRRRMVLAVALEVDSSTAMKAAVLRCNLAAALPAHAVQAEVKRGELTALPITHPAINQSTFVESTKKRPASAAVREVEKALIALLSQLQVDQA